MRNTLFQENINLIKTKVVEAIKQERIKMVQKVRDSYFSILQALSDVLFLNINQDDDTDPTATSTLTESENSMDKKDIKQEMLKILVKLDKKLDESLKTIIEAINNIEILKIVQEKQEIQGQRQASKQNRKSWNVDNTFQEDISMYFYKCGACNHLGKD